MCGRITYHFSPGDLIKAQLLFAQLELAIPPQLNVAPTQQIPIIRQDQHGRRNLSFARWGLVPSWADDPKIGSRMFNARSEEASRKPSFRSAFKSRRCLIPVSGFYEWKVVSSGPRPQKQPMLITVKDSPVFALAGLWEHWTKEGQSLETATILTRAANEFMQPIHDRMPVIVPANQYGVWLETTRQTPEALADVLVGTVTDQLEANTAPEALSATASSVRTRHACDTPLIPGLFAP